MLEDDRLPLLVFGALSLVEPGLTIEIEGTPVPLPRPAGLILEKLVTDRTGEKGERDLLVALGLLATSGPADLDELVESYRRLRAELRHAVRSNLTILSLLRPRGDARPCPEARGRGGIASPPRGCRARHEMTSVERRLRQLRSRVLVRAWDFRQRHHSRGVWYRLRRVLADAREAYGISPRDAELLLAEGHAVEPVGAELAPARTIIFADADRVTRLASARPLVLSLNADLLAAECLALVRFPPS